MRGEQGKNPSLGLAALAALLTAALALAATVRGPAGGPETSSADLRPAQVEPVPKSAELPAAPVFEGLDLLAATITAYSSTPEQTDDTPWLTATSTRTRPGVIALSRDLLRTFTEGAPFDFGDRVLVAGVGIFRVEDTMHHRWRERADIWFPTESQARQWGHRKALIAPVEDQRLDHLVAQEAHLISILESN